MKSTSASKWTTHNPAEYPSAATLSMTRSSLSDEITYGGFTILVPPMRVWPTLRQSASIADHIEICQPETGDAFVYKSTRDFVSEVARPHSEPARPVAMLRGCASSSRRHVSRSPFLSPDRVRKLAARRIS